MKTRITRILRQLKVVSKNPYFVFSCAFLLGVLFFISFFGLSVVNPRNVNWLMHGDDLKQHYVGWVFYRHSTQVFPFGKITGLAYPYGLAVTYMDSIPLLAIPFKLISAILPSNFQYFGLWGVLCYGLQGGIAALIIRKWSKNIVFILLGATLFITNPVMLDRMFHHTALASQWIILLAILAVLEWRKIVSLKKQLIVWSVLLVLAALIHPYFLPMVGSIFVVSLILSHERWVTSLIKFIVPLFLSMVVFWSIGGFSISDTAGVGLGIFNLNINSLLNPQGWSAYLPTLPTVTITDESLGFIGLGILLLIPVLVCIFVLEFKNIKNIVNILKLDIRTILIIIVSLILLILSLSPRIQYGARVLATISLPSSIEKLWSIFRASGRLFWPIYYFIMVGVVAGVATLSRKMSPTLLCLFFGVFVLIQVIDIRISPSAHVKKETISAYQQPYVSPLSLSKWNSLVGNKKHMVDLDPMSVEDFFKLVDVTSEDNLTMNTGYFARTPLKQIEGFQNLQRSKLLSGTADTIDNLYISTDMNFLSKIRSNHKYTITEVDNYFVIE